MTIYSDINPNTTSGTELANLLNLFKDSFASMNKDDTRDSNLAVGGIWVDDTNDASSTWDLKMWNGTNDITLLTVNKDTLSVIFGSVSDEIEIVKTSDDTNPAILELRKARATGNQTQDGDVVGQVDFSGTTTTPTTEVMARIKAVATDNVTAAAHGADLVFYSTADGLSSLVEYMRLKNSGAFGVGTDTPESKLHVQDNDVVAIKVKRVEATADPAEVIISKKRVATNGQVLTDDVVGRVLFEGTDDDGDLTPLAKIEAVALEDIDDTNHGTKISMSVKGEDETSYTELLSLEKGNVQLAGYEFNEYSATPALAHGGTLQSLFSVDSTVFGAFEATVFGYGTDGSDARSTKATINGVYDGSNWNTSYNTGQLEGEDLFTLDITDASTILVKYLNQLNQGTFVGGKVYIKVRRFSQ